jgi:ferredoxin
MTPARRRNGGAREWWLERWTRGRHRAEHRLTPLLGRWSDTSLDGRLRLLRHLPLLPRPLQRFASSRVWPAPSLETPEALRTVPGSARNPEAEEAAFAARPFHHFVDVHTEAGKFAVSNGWGYIIPSAPRILRGKHRIAQVRARMPKRSAPKLTPQQAVESIQQRARELNISTVGFAPHDPKYTFAPYAEQQEPSVIVVVIEQDHAATQTAPSLFAERAAFRGYADLDAAAAELAAHVQDLGYRARPHGFIGEGVVIHYAVQAGLGQLGLNGQLLTPQAGSRARIGLITTNADVIHGAPIDFGVTAICDACQICVRRCPPGAIPIKRQEFRGVVKAKIKPERCFPVLAQTHGCAVCMKVCPVQRWGLDAVKEHFVATGEILGKGTDELEGYRWPLDGRFYGSGEKPRISDELLNPPGWQFDRERTAPTSPSVIRAGVIVKPNDVTVV